MGTDKAIVVGAGIGGLTAARALQSIGWRVALYEQAPLIGPVGAGLAIAPNAVKALDHLGLGAALRERGLRQDGLEIRLRGGRRVARIPAAGIERRYGAPFYALHRAEMHRLLMTGLDPSVLHTGRRATDVTTAADTATVTFDTAHGLVTETADLVVAADGVGSGLRAALLPDYPGADYAGYTVWRGIVPAERAAPLGMAPILTETWGRGARFGVAAINDGQVYWFAAEGMPEHATPERDLDKVAGRFRDWHEPIPELLAATPEDALLRHDVYYLHARLPTFVRGRVALLGDAAHHTRHRSRSLSRDRGRRDPCRRHRTIRRRRRLERLRRHPPPPHPADGPYVRQAGPHAADPQPSRSGAARHRRLSDSDPAAHGGGGDGLRLESPFGAGEFSVTADEPFNHPRRAAGCGSPGWSSFLIPSGRRCGSGPSTGRGCRRRSRR